MNRAGHAGSDSFVPISLRPELPVERLVRREPPDAEAVALDVLIVGGGPAGLAAAIELARLSGADHSPDGESPAGLEIGVLEKAAALGEHCLSGAVVDPSPFAELFPEVPSSELPLRGAVGRDRVYLLTRSGRVRIPTPPPMRNHGKRVASICEIVRWLGDRAEAAGVHVFTGFPADALLMDGERVTGVRTTPTGLDRSGSPGSGYMPPTDLKAQVTILAEGSRGALSQAYLTERGIGSENPQIYALGVKELWRVERPPKAVVHTLGWPVPRDAFGGSWLYPMGDGLVSLGLVVGLDYRQQSLDVHALLQRLKLHPFVRPILEGGEMLEWGARTIPEGGYWSMPDRLHGDGLLLTGDAAGFVDVPSLKGIHYAMFSGMFAARAAFRALKSGDTSAVGLSDYDRMVRGSVIVRDLYRRRNMRTAFKSGFWSGGALSALAILTGGRIPRGRIAVSDDAAEPRRAGSTPEWTPDGRLTFSKVDAVFRSGNSTRDDIPAHLIPGQGITPQAADFYAHMCPAGVYEWSEEGLLVNAPNCVDCKATDVLGPRWTPREGGSGPRYSRM